jgi:putative acetyltransferase
MPLTLRGLEPSDARAVHRLASDPDVARTGGGSPYDSEDAWIARLATPAPDRHLFLGAFDGDALVGLGILDAQVAVRRRHVGRVAVVVASHVRRRGVGSQLLSALVESAERWFGHLRIELSVQADHEAAIGLYRKHGFEIETHARADMLRDGVLVDAIGMARIRPGCVVPAELGEVPAIPVRRERLAPLVRARRKSDAARMAQLHSEPSVMEGTWQMPFQTEAAWAARFEATPAGSTVLVAEVDGRIVGSSGLFPIGAGARKSHAASFGISVHPSVQGCGVGDALIRAILDQADQWLGLRRVELDVYVDNDRARALYERHGFVTEGRCRMMALRRGTYVDSFTMARVRL